MPRMALVVQFCNPFGPVLFVYGYFVRPIKLRSKVKCLVTKLDDVEKRVSDKASNTLPINSHLGCVGPKSAS